MLQCPLEACNVGRSQPLFALSLKHEEAFGELLLQVAYDVGGAVGRVVLHHQYVKVVLQGKDGPDDVFDVLALVIGWYDDDAV